jgi:hypothetical protein
VEADLVLRKMESAGNRLNVVILDACRNNPFARSFRSANRGLGRMEAPRGTLIAYSTAPGSVAYDGPAGENSPYTQHLVEAIQRPGLPIEQMFKHVRQSVLKSTDGEQTPWESSSLTGDFYFTVNIAIHPPTSRDGASPQTGGASAPNKVSPDALDMAYWDAIKNNPSQAALQSYLKKFPNGHFAELARIRLEERGSPPAPKPPSSAKSPSRILGQGNLLEGLLGNGIPHVQPEEVPERLPQGALLGRAADGVPLGALLKGEPDVTGSYRVQGTNPNGSRYQGSATLEREDKHYRIRWNIAGTIFSGTGRFNDGRLEIRWTNDSGSAGGRITYRVDKDGVLHGLWSDGNAREELFPEE